MFPFYKQHDSMQCGITCLQMICKYYGKEYSLESLSRYCFATTEGVSMLGISEAANNCPKPPCPAFCIGARTILSSSTK